MLEKKLIELGCEGISYYSLINNYGYDFTKNGVHYNIRHWLNCYGVEVDFWTLENYENQNMSSFDTVENLIEAIKNI